MRRLHWAALLPVALLGIGVALLSLPHPLTPSPTLDVYTAPVQDAMAWVEARSTTDYDRISYTAQYVSHLTYTPVGDTCLTQTASDVLASGHGDCVSFSKAAAAILTGLDIPVLILEGCLFTYTGDAATGDLKAPPPTPIPRDDTVKQPEGASRRGLGPRRGQLHNWLRAYDGRHWWTVETTTGHLFPTWLEPSFGYNKYGGVVDPDDPFALCYLTDDAYVRFCQDT